VETARKKQTVAANEQLEIEVVKHNGRKYGLENIREEN
jgi:hypothetical protein